LSAHGGGRRGAEATNMLLTRRVGSRCWMSPEMLHGECYSFSSDIYSLTMVLWEVLTCQAPFDDVEDEDALMAALLAGATPSIPDWCPAPFAALLREGWQRDASRRPTAAQILKRLEGMLAELERDYALPYLDCSLFFRPGAREESLRHQQQLWEEQERQIREAELQRQHQLQQLQQHQLQMELQQHPQPCHQPYHYDALQECASPLPGMDAASSERPLTPEEMRLRHEQQLQALEYAQQQQQLQQLQQQLEWQRHQQQLQVQQHQQPSDLQSHQHHPQSHLVTDPTSRTSVSLPHEDGEFVFDEENDHHQHEHEPCGGYEGHTRPLASSSMTALPVADSTVVRVQH
jgi:serine/threonine protein kinase